MRELIFDVIQEADGGYSAECLTETIATEGDTWEEVRAKRYGGSQSLLF